MRRLMSRWHHPLPWLLALVGYSLWQQADGWLGLLDGQSWRQMGNFLATSWPPRLDQDFLALTLTATLQSLAVATLGLAGALLLGIPFALLGSRALSLAELGPIPSPLRGALRAFSRLIAILLRSLPELIWALLFVRLSGLGPLAAILAIAVSYGGMLAKVYNEIMESGALQPARALLLGGSGRLQALWYGVLPAVRQELLSYTVYRWECALRASVIMGFVGAGGLGQQLELSLRMFAGGEVVTLLLAFILLVTLADGLSAWLRHTRSPGLQLLACLGLASAMALHQLDWRMLSFSFGGLGRFIGEFLQPDWSGPFLRTVGLGLLDTIAEYPVERPAGPAAGLSRPPLLATEAAVQPAAIRAGAHLRQPAGDRGRAGAGGGHTGAYPAHHGRAGPAVRGDAGERGSGPSPRLAIERLRPHGQLLVRAVSTGVTPMAGLQPLSRRDEPEGRYHTRGGGRRGAGAAALCVAQPVPLRSGSHPDPGHLAAGLAG